VRVSVTARVFLDEVGSIVTPERRSTSPARDESPGSLSQDEAQPASACERLVRTNVDDLATSFAIVTS